jgi:queuosine precursor transporter
MFALLQPNLSFSPVRILSTCHIALLTLSNILVQYPFTLFGFHTTWGAFSYPVIFILTDLTTRIMGSNMARKIIFRSMIPGLLLSYSIASYIDVAHMNNWHDMFLLHIMPLRIACACFVAYVVGQLLDIHVFQRYQNNTSWWLAPTLSSTAGNLIDTFLFFFIAFYHSTNPFLSQHWLEIASVDMIFKLAISLIAFVPVYGFILITLGITTPIKHVSE